MVSLNFLSIKRAALTLNSWNTHKICARWMLWNWQMDSYVLEDFVQCSSHIVRCPVHVYWLPLNSLDMFMFDHRCFCLWLGLEELNKVEFIFCYLVQPRLFNPSLIMSSLKRKNVDSIWMNVWQVVKSQFFILR